MGNKPKARKLNPDVEGFMREFKRRRLAAGLSQTDIARRLRVRQSTVYAWESGGHLPSPARIPKLANILGISPLDLISTLHPEPPASAPTSAN